MGEYAATEGSLDATGMRFAIAVARFNRDVTEVLLDGAERVLRKQGAADAQVVWVPGAFELPLVAKKLAASGTVDAVICLGAVIRGETAHFDLVANEAARGIAEVARTAELRAATCCDTCRSDDGREVRIAVELRTPTLPHAACPKGPCRCRWFLADRDRTIVTGLLRRQRRAPRRS